MGCGPAATNLHLASGFPEAKLAELHGNGQRMRCLGCDERFSLKEVGWDRRVWGEGYRTQRVRPGQPSCPERKGRLISSVVNFGDPLPVRELSEAFKHSEQADVFLVIGSSLVVSPANDMPAAAVEYGAKLILLNQGETPSDKVADLCIREGIGEVLPAVASQVRELLGPKARGAQA